MNILMISPFDLVVKRLWGPTIRLHSLAKELNLMGHHVILAGPHPFEGDRPQMLDGVKMFYFKRPFHRYPYTSDDRSNERKKNNYRRRIPLVLWSRFVELIKLVKNHNIDCLYLNRSFLDTLYPTFAVHLIKRIPIVCDWDDLEGLHGFSTSFFKPLRLQLFETVNEVIFPRLANATVVASSYLKEFALKIGVNEKKLFYAPTVADSNTFHPDVDGTSIRAKYGLKKRNILFYCGNLMEGNGVRVENIFYTLKFLLKKNPAFSLLVVGEGDLIKKKGAKGKLVKLAETLGISDRVTFAGGVPYAEVPQYMAAADLCLALFPVNLITMSKSPLKVYEYMASGKPVIARDIGELSKCVIDGETGILVYSDNPEEFAAKILDSFSRKGLLQEMGKKAKLLIDEKFTWEHSAKIALEAFQMANTIRQKD